MSRCEFRVGQKLRGSYKQFILFGPLSVVMLNLGHFSFLAMSQASHTRQF